MTSLLQNFLAARAAKPKQPVVNGAQPVTRAEFNTLALAVNALIEDLDAATSPDKLKALLNSAFDPAAIANTAPTTPRPSGFIAPNDDEGNIIPPRKTPTATVRNAVKPSARAPLALKSDFIAPKGE